jgi:hypothetical protein
MAMSDKISDSEIAPPWPPTTHEFLAIKVACRQLGVRAAVDELELQRVLDDIMEAPPIPAPAAQNNRYVAFADYIVDRHYWMDPFLDLWVCPKQCQAFLRRKLTRGTAGRLLVGVGIVG